MSREELKENADLVEVSEATAPEVRLNFYFFGGTFVGRSISRDGSTFISPSNLLTSKTHCISDALVKQLLGLFGQLSSIGHHRVRFGICIFSVSLFGLSSSESILSSLQSILGGLDLSLKLKRRTQFISSGSFLCFGILCSLVFDIGEKTYRGCVLGRLGSLKVTCVRIFHKIEVCSTSRIGFSLCSSCIIFSSDRLSLRNSCFVFSSSLTFGGEFLFISSPIFSSFCSLSSFSLQDKGCLYLFSSDATFSLSSAFFSVSSFVNGVRRLILDSGSIVCDTIITVSIGSNSNVVFVGYRLDSGSRTSLSTGSLLVQSNGLTTTDWCSMSRRGSENGSGKNENETELVQVVWIERE
ncbi:hypothetical protein DL96DRAFT_1590180, partial [Flagelloscypha sp. PMI_526]